MKFFHSKLFVILASIVFVLWLLSLNYHKVNKPFIYGVSFSRFHADELELDWKETYLAILHDLGVRNFRFSAHWHITEPKEGKFNFTELDFQIKEAEKKNASVILAVGRRLPGWPECHEPDWAKSKDKDSKQENILKYIETVVNRYKGSPAIKYWQVENEPYLTFFSRSTCGPLDEDFLAREINFVKSLDSSRPIIVTDSGEFGTWLPAYRRGDIFGTSLYLYIWNHRFGPLRYPITPAFFRIKKNIISLLSGGSKESFVIELSAEPWLLQPIIKTPIDVQMQRMGIDKFNEMIEFSDKTGFDKFYLWGAEWWYWLKLRGDDQHWSRAREIFSNEKIDTSNNLYIKSYK